MNGHPISNTAEAWELRFERYKLLNGTSMKMEMTKTGSTSILTNNLTRPPESMMTTGTITFVLWDR